MPISYAPLPLQATTGRSYAASITTLALQESGIYSGLDLSDYDDLTFLCGSVSVTEDTVVDDGFAIERTDEASGKFDLRLSADHLDTFTLKAGLEFTPFNWAVTGIYSGDTDPTEIASGVLRISEGVGQ